MRRCISDLDNALTSARLKLTTVEILIECAGLTYRSLFHATAPLNSRK